MMPAACRPSLWEICVKLENSLPLDSTPTVNTGMPAASMSLVILVNVFSPVDWTDRQSIWSALKSASIWAICSLESWTADAGAMAWPFIGRIFWASGRVRS